MAAGTLRRPSRTAGWICACLLAAMLAGCAGGDGASRSAGAGGQTADPGGGSPGVSRSAAPSPSPTGPRDLTEREQWSSGASPKAVAFTPDGSQIWVTLLLARGVRVFDSRTGERIDEIPLGEYGGVEIAFTSDGETAYVSQMKTASVYEIDTETRNVRRRIDTEGVWSKVVALSPDERTLYASNWVSDDVSVIDLDSGEVREVIDTVATPRGLYVTPDGDTLYVAGYEDGTIQRIDLASGDKEVLTRTGGAMRHLVGDPRRGVVYASEMSEGAVYTVDTDSGRVRKLASVDQKPNTIELSPDGRMLFVSCRGRNGETYHQPGPEWGTVVVLDVRTGKWLDALVGGDQTTGLDVSAGGRLLAFSDFLDGRVSTYAVPAYERLRSGDGVDKERHRERLRK